MTEFSSEIEAMLTRHGLAPDDGAAIGIMREGKTVATYARGLANRALDRTFDINTSFRICSITKHFTCFLVLKAEEGGLIDLRDHPRKHLPSTSDFHPDLTIYDLCTNRSGLTDYWCAAMLFGAEAETRFEKNDADRLLRHCGRAPDAPGTRFSYCNTNFLILGRILEEIYDAPLSEQLARGIFEPVGMNETFLGADTAVKLPTKTVGYEHIPERGSVEADTNLVWEGDAGIVSTLYDLLLWEQHFHNNTSGSFQRLAKLTDNTALGGSNTGYGFGMRVARRRDTIEHIHTGGLRGWRSARLFLPDCKLSVIVLFNHMTDPARIARAVADHVLNRQAPRGNAAASEQNDDPSLLISRPYGLVARLLMGNEQCKLECGGRTIVAERQSSGVFETVDDNGETTRISIDPSLNSVALSLPDENTAATFTPIPRDEDDDVSAWTGVYKNDDDLGSVTIEPDEKQTAAIRFEGFLGASRPVRLNILSSDVATFDCPRALDLPAPGVFSVLREGDGGKQSLRVSCWHARGAVFQRVKA